MGLWLDVHHDFEAGAMSYHDIVAAVAAMAWEYPYFTWDEAGLGLGPWMPDAENMGTDGFSTWGQRLTSVEPNALRIINNY